MRALSSSPAIGLYLSTLDRPVSRAQLDPTQRALADELLSVGLLEEKGNRLLATATHHRDPDVSTPAVLARRAAVIGYAGGVIADARKALETRGEAAHAAAGFVRLPDDPAVVARAIAIIAEAEDQLRALAEDARKDGDRDLQCIIFLGSTP